MRRDEILRDDFPTSRKGWDREAVSEHLEAVATAHEALQQDAGAPTGTTPSTAPNLSTAAGEQIGRVIAAGEELAAEIERAAREQAEGVLERARGEAEAIRAAAERDAAGERDRVRSESDAIVVQLREVVAQTATEAERAQQRIGEFADELGSQGTDRATTRVPDSPAATEPLAVAEPQADESAEAAAPTPATPEPTDEPVLDAATEPAPEPPAEPEPTPEPKSEPAAAAPASSSDQEAAARLVAMNLALEGADAKQIKADLAADFGGVSDLDALVADVLARSGR